MSQPIAHVFKSYSLLHSFNMYLASARYMPSTALLCFSLKAPSQATNVFFSRVLETPSELLEKAMATHSVLLPGKSRRRRSLVGCGPRGRGMGGSRGEAGRWSLVCTSQSMVVSYLDISFPRQQPCLLQTAGRRCPCASPPMGAVGGSHFPERVNKNSLRFLKNKYTLLLQQAELVCLSHAYFSRNTGHARFANKS